MWQVLHNGTAGPVVIDAEGRQLGAGEWGVGDTTDPVTKAADDAGDVSVVPDQALTGDIIDEARDARAEAKARNARAEQVRALDKPVLAQAAADAGLGLPEDADKDALVRALTAAGIVPDEPEPDEPADEPRRAGSRAAAKTETPEG